MTELNPALENILGISGMAARMGKGKAEVELINYLFFF